MFVRLACLPDPEHLAQHLLVLLVVSSSTSQSLSAQSHHGRHSLCCGTGWYSFWVKCLVCRTSICLPGFCSCPSTCFLLLQIRYDRDIIFPWTFFFFWLFSCCLINYSILQVDGTNLQGFTNQQAVDVLRHTGQTVRLTLIRRGLKQENHIQPQEEFNAAVERDLLLPTMDSGTAKGN